MEKKKPVGLVHKLAVLVTSLVVLGAGVYVYKQIVVCDVCGPVNGSSPAYGNCSVIGGYGYGYGYGSTTGCTQNGGSCGYGYGYQYQCKLP